MHFTKEVFLMIEEKENEVVKCILEDCRYDHTVITEKTTLLHCAARHGNVELTKYLLDKGCHVDAQDSDTCGITPLMLAVDKRHGRIIQALLTAGADIDIQNDIGGDALSFALEQYPTIQVHEPLFSALRKIYSSEEIAKRLIDDRCWLDTAVFSRDAKIVEHMILSGVPVDFPIEKSPLHVAVSLSDVETVKVLLRHGADINALDLFGATPLRMLYTNDSGDNHKKLQILQILLSNGASMMSCNAQGLFQVAPALVNGTCEIVKAILQSKVDFTARNIHSGGTMLHALVFNRNPGIVDVLKPHIGKFDINVTDKFGHKALSYAVSEGNAVFAKFLLENGAMADAAALLSVYFVTIDSNQCSDMECLRDECAELLLQHNADPQVIFTIKNRLQMTAVETAIENQSFDRVKLAVAQLAICEKQGAPVNELVCSKINSHQSLKSYFDKCRRLLREKISGSASVFDLLIADEKKVAKYLNNSELAVKLARMGHKKEFQSAYRCYYSTLKKKFTKGIVSKTLRYKTAKIIRHISKNRLGLRGIPTDIIIDNLSDNDLRRSYKLLISM